jgi:hypothetical protein
MHLLPSSVTTDVGGEPDATLFPGAVCTFGRGLRVTSWGVPFLHVWHNPQPHSFLPCDIDSFTDACHELEKKLRVSSGKRNSDPTEPAQTQFLLDP